MTTRPLRIECDLCNQGIVRHGGDWPTRCAFCLGRGSLSLERLCEKIGESPSTVRKLLRPGRPMRAKVAYRILGRLTQELFR